MDRQEKMLIAVDASALSRIEEKLDALLRLLERSDVQSLPEWVTVSQAAAREGVSASTIRRRIDSGELEAKGAGKGRRVKV